MAPARAPLLRAVGAAAVSRTPPAPSRLAGRPLARHCSAASAASATAASPSDSLMSAVLGDDGGPEAGGSWGRGALEPIPSAVDASAMQDGEAKLSKRQLTEVATEVLALHALRPMRSVSHYASTAPLRVRRAGHAENHYELVTHFQRLARWLHVTPLPAPSAAAAAAPPMNLKRIRTRGGGGASGAGGAGDDGPEERQRSGTAEDPRRGREVAAANKQRDQAKQRAAARQGQGQGGGDGGVSAVARRRRIQEMSSKPVWQHTPAWEGWLTVPTQTYGLRIKYPTLKAQVPVIQFKNGVFCSFQVESRIHLTLSSDGTVLNQLWEHEGGMVFSAVLALANRGQSIVSAAAARPRPAAARFLTTTAALRVLSWSDDANARFSFLLVLLAHSQVKSLGNSSGTGDAEAEAAAATAQIRRLIAVGGVGLIAILGVQLTPSGY